MLHLPYEIERKVFQLAADVHPTGDSHAYLLVAQRVRHWIEGLIYNTIILTSETRACRFVDSLHFRPAFAEAKVMSLCLDGTVQLATATEIMRLCSGVKDLALWILPEGFGPKDIPVVPDLQVLLDVLTALPLSRLSIHLSTIFRRTVSPSLSSIHLFSKITHLELLEGWVLWSSPIGIQCLAQLTHLSLRMLLHHTSPALLQQILTDCVHLQVLVLRVTNGVRDVEKWLVEHEGLANDPRIVVTTKIPRDTWGGDGMGPWEYGECIMKDRLEEIFGNITSQEEDDEEEDEDE